MIDFFPIEYAMSPQDIVICVARIDLPLVYDRFAGKHELNNTFNTAIVWPFAVVGNSRY